jgi:hypothetical protein
MGTELFYKPGSFYRVCERTGFATRAERTQREWQGLFVRREVFEPRQPQDFVRGVPDIQTVPYSRPRPADVFIQTELTSQITVYGDLPGRISFEVIGGQFQCFAGTVPPVNPANFPSSF